MQKCDSERMAVITCIPSRIKNATGGGGQLKILCRKTK